VGPGNPALLNFDFNTTETRANCAAAVIAYLNKNGPNMAAGTKLVGIMARAAGEPGSVQVPFPIVEFGSLWQLGGSNPLLLNYGPIQGNIGRLCPLGTSIVVSETSGEASRRGRGRHYLPFIQEGCVAANGGVRSDTIAGIVTIYRQYFGLDTIGATGQAPQVKPCVTSSGAAVGPTPYYDITSVKPSSVFSNLRSRRR
jgi:hypothetical protein